jgi:hypothetical protein
MSEAIGQILPLALAAALSPIPIIGVVLVMVAPRARVNGPAVLVGWLLALAAIGTVVLLVAGSLDATGDGDPATWVGIVQILLGGVLLLVALKAWRGRPHGDEEPVTPTWMGAIDSFTAAKALGAGAALAGINPKNLLLAIGATVTIAKTGIPGDEQALAYGVFTLISSIGVATPLVIYFALGERAGPLLARVKAWMAHNNGVIMAVICLLLGAKLLGDGISAL